jgi:hypothetical protein
MSTLRYGAILLGEDELSPNDAASATTCDQAQFGDLQPNDVESATTCDQAQFGGGLEHSFFLVF